MADPNIITPDKLEPWEYLNLKVEKLTNSVYGTWSNELTNLLIFASLFSAILTAFTVEAAKSVRVDPTEETNLLLRALILQFQNISLPQTNLPINLQLGNPADSISPYAQLIYLLYSVSLALSLIAVLGGITCFQWLREFSQNVTGVSPSIDIYVQFQRHKSLRQWRVITLLNTLPVLLLISLFLFFAGFLTSQWESGAHGATPVTVLVSIAALFILVTSFLPALQILWLAYYKQEESSFINDLRDHDDRGDEALLHLVLCPYRSPQALLVLSIFRYIARVIPGMLYSKSLPKINSWTGYDRLWIDKHTTDQSIYPALNWVAMEFNQSKDTVIMVYQCLISQVTNSYRDYLKGLQPRVQVPDSTPLSTFGFRAMTHFEEQFITDKSILVRNTYLAAFSRLWEVIVDNGLKVQASNDIYQILRVKGAPWRDCTDLLKTTNNTLSRPENVWMTEDIAVATACYVIDQHRIDFNNIPAILRELCKRYQNNRSLHQHVYRLCNKLHRRADMEHSCSGLVYIFNRIFPRLDHLGNLGFALQELLVRCDQCNIFWVHASNFLKIIEDLASHHLIGKDHSLDEIFLFTPHLIKYCTGLHRVVPVIETTLDAILFAADEHIHFSRTPSSRSILHPSRFYLSHTVAHPNFPNANVDLKPVWDLTDSFNKRLKEMWDRWEGEERMGRASDCLEAEKDLHITGTAQIEGDTLPKETVSVENYIPGSTSGIDNILTLTHPAISLPASP